MSVSTMMPMAEMIAFDYRAGGEVLCKNPKGLIFFLRAEAPMRPATPPPAPRAWQPVEASREVDVKRHAEPQSMTEMQRTVPQAAAGPAPAPTFTAVAATHEVEVRRAAEPAAAPARGTAPLPNVPEPGAAPQKGWFGKLFKK